MFGLITKQMLLLLVGGFALAGCATSWERSTTANATGCAPEEIKVASESGAFDAIRMWNATCRGKTFRCVFVGGDKGGCYQT